MEYGTKLKGLENQAGSNNCFLNVILQAFWHLPSFRSNFQLTSYEHSHSVPTLCLVCEIRTLFLDYEYNEDQAISSVNVRRALQALIPAFGSSTKACAVELFELILSHFHSISEDCKGKCYNHKVFGYEFCDELSCDCIKDQGETFTDHIIRAYVSELYQFSQNSKISDLDALLGMSLASQSRLWPCQSCGQIKFFKKILVKKAKVLALSFAWNEITPKMVQWFCSLISPVLFLKNLFNLSDDQPDYLTRYVFKGMICYVASHYVAFFYSLRRNVWVEFDDSQVMIIYDWNEALGKIMKGKMAPVLMFYELDSELDAIKRELQLEYIENECGNYLLDPNVYFDSFADTLDLDLAGMIWKVDLAEYKATKKCSIC